MNYLLAISNNGCLLPDAAPCRHNNWSYTVHNPFGMGTTNITLRGYTFHEHLPHFSLINMNGRLYDNVLCRMLSPDNFIQAPNNTQSFNRYSYCWNNPLKYTDPSGEIVWVLTTVGWSKQGGLSVGLMVGVGLPGAASLQTGLGYSFSNNDAYGFVSATFAFNSVYTSYSYKSGNYAGYAVGITPYSGVPISTNFFSTGVNYNITNDSWSGNVSAWSIDRNGVSFNPSLSVMVMPERTTNFFMGQGFRTNDQVLARFVAAGNQQGAQDYFGFEGTYDPGNKNLNGAPAVTTTYSGETYFDAHAFTNGFDYLYAVSDHEFAHRQQFKAIGRKMYFDAKNDVVNSKLEYQAFIRNYKNQGLYRKFDRNDLQMRINTAGTSANLPYDTNHGRYIEPSHLHLYYRIPRKW